MPSVTTTSSTACQTVRHLLYTIWMSTRYPRRAGFTLVEVLTVSAIVGMLGALLLPSLSAARDRSRAAACVNNLRQVGQAAFLYYDDFNRLPTAGRSGYLLWNGTAFVLYGQVMAVSGGSIARTFYCPSATSFAPADPNTGIQNLGVISEVTAGNYCMRGQLQDGAPSMLGGPTVSLIADNFYGSGDLRNHPAGVNVLSSDGSVRFVALPSNWSMTQTGAWSDLDQRW